MNNQLTTDEIKEIKSLKTQNLAIFSLIVASGISIHINNGDIDMIINKENSTFTEEKIDTLAKISNIIIWIAAIYFTILNIKAYEKEKTKTNASFLAAALLALNASSIRLFTILNNNRLEIAADDLVL